jgi:hypothetical protein
VQKGCCQKRVTRGTAKGRKGCFVKKGTSKKTESWNGHAIAAIGIKMSLQLAWSFFAVHTLVEIITRPLNH